MERRAKRKNKEDPVTATKATKPKGGANECLATDPSALNVNLMEQVLSQKNLQLNCGLRFTTWHRISPGCPPCDGPILLNRRMRSRMSGDVGAGS